MKKLIPIVSLFLFASLYSVASEIGDRTIPADVAQLSDSLKRQYAPDKRVALFDVDYSFSGKNVMLRGVTYLCAAAKVCTTERAVKIVSVELITYPSFRFVYFSCIVKPALTSIDHELAFLKTTILQHKSLPQATHPARSSTLQHYVSVESNVLKLQPIWLRCTRGSRTFQDSSSIYDFNILLHDT